MLKKLAVFALVSLVLTNYSSAIWIESKARLAQILIQQAWSATLTTGETHRPWSWADTWPVARIRHANSGTDLYVLEGAEGSSLAFGPGHHQGTALPGEGASLIGGHRDTHFKFLRDAQLRDELKVQTMDGIWRDYEISLIDVRNSDTDPLYIDADRNAIYLVTCFPFDALIPGGPMRYLVVAEPRIEAEPFLVSSR